MTKTFTSESVCSGHPDKVCDSISDAILDEVLRQDPYGRVAVETMVTFNRIVLAGEVTSTAEVDFEKAARAQVKRLGYKNTKYNFSYKSPLEVYIHQQSKEIAKGVLEKGAGDQGMMFGYARRDTPQFMPLAIMMAHDLVRKIDEMRERKVLAYLRPDGKSQVTVESHRGKPVAVRKIIVAVPHKEEIKLGQVRSDIFKHVVKPIVEGWGFKTTKADLVINGTGVWHMGGPASDTGVTGRKIVVDGYGGYARVGGGCFSGKDPTKVDRSGAYAARFIAKNIVANNLADKAEVRLAYFIGAKKPLMQEVETFGTAKVRSRVIADFANKILKTSVEGIISGLDLRRPIYLPTSAYGHFGRDEFPWEKIVSV